MDHSGGFLSYISRLYLFREKDAAMFISVNTDGGDSSLGQKSILSFLSDKLLNLDPWLNATTACSFPSPWTNPRLRKNNTFPDVVNRDTEDLLHYRGNYGSYLWGKVTIGGPQDGYLTIQVNTLITGRLYPVDQEGSFVVQVKSPQELEQSLSLMTCNFVIPCRDCNNVTFSMDSTQGILTFYRNVKFTDSIPKITPVDAANTIISSKVFIFITSLFIATHLL